MVKQIKSGFVSAVAEALFGMLETKPKVCGSVGTLLLQFRLFAWSVDKSLVKLSASWQILQNSIPSELSSATNPKCGFLLMYL